MAKKNVFTWKQGKHRVTVKETKQGVFVTSFFEGKEEPIEVGSFNAEVAMDVARSFITEIQQEKG